MANGDSPLLHDILGDVSDKTTLLVVAAHNHRDEPQLFRFRKLHRGTYEVAHP